MLTLKTRLLGLRAVERREFGQKAVFETLLVRNAENDGGSLMAEIQICEKAQEADCFNNRRRPAWVVWRQMKAYSLRRAGRELSEIVGEPVKVIKDYVNQQQYTRIGFSSRLLNQNLDPLDLIALKLARIRASFNRMLQLNGITNNHNEDVDDDYLLLPGLREPLDNPAEVRMERLLDYQKRLGKQRERILREEAKKLLDEEEKEGN